MSNGVVTCDRTLAHLYITFTSHRAASQDLKFKICEIEMSYYRNKEIEGIWKRVDRAIMPVLLYASQYWAESRDVSRS